MHLSPVQITLVAIALGSVSVQIATLSIFSKRKLRSELPIFFRYTACSAILGILGTAMYIFACECREYYYFNLVFGVLTACFQFGVMYESFVNALKPYSALIDLGKLLFRWAGAFLLLAALLTGFAGKTLELTTLLGAENDLERVMGLMATGLLLLFFAFERRLGLAWRSYSMAVALGLGTMAAVNLSTPLILGRFPEWQPAISLLNGLVCFAVATFWAVCFWRGEPARRNVLDSPSRLIFQRWNEALLAYGYGRTAAAAPSGVESFLPGIEKTVERVMAKTLH